MFNLEIAILVMSFLAILVGLGCAGVGVFVLLRTAAVKGLEVEVAKLADLVKTFRSRDARRQTAPTRERETDTAEEAASSGVVDMEQRKAQVASEFHRRTGR